AGSIIYLKVSNELYKIERTREEIVLSLPGESEKPLIIIEMTRNLISPVINEIEPSKIKELFRNSYIKGDIKVKVAAPTAMLVSSGVALILRELGLTCDKNN
ncbi:MAG: hypothetical protein QXV01_11665, partial [Candidatus Bathyarchaeia archaeon]